MSNPIASNRQKCPFCGKIAQEIKRKRVSKSDQITLECGHTLFVKRLEVTLQAVVENKTPEQLEIEEAVAFASKDNKHPYPYQMRSTHFFEACGLNGICAHEMGVGKMVIANLLVKRNLKEVAPVLMVVKSGLRYQAALEFFRWAGLTAQVIEGANDLPLFEYGFQVFLISYDTLRLVRPDIDRAWEDQFRQFGEDDGKIIGINRKRNGGAKRIKWTDEICAKFKFVIFDECQLIKNPDASRTRAAKKIVSAWQRVKGGVKPRIMGLSGTPIKNDASEYGTILHLVNPTMFPSETGFIARDCVPVGNGNRYKLKNPEAFHEKTKGFIQRYTREEVLPELPSISRMFRYAEVLPGAELDKYMDAVKEFQDFMDKATDTGSGGIGMRDITNILGYFSKMRRITGTAKVDEAMDFIEEFLLDTERKLVVFVHHHETANLLYAKLEKLMQEANMDLPLLAMPPFDARRRQEIIDQFRGVEVEQLEDGSYKEVPTGKNHRVMIASTQAVGEGFNLQFCSDCLIMERQWNPSNEEQAEARFPRPGTLLGREDKINATYLIAAGTIDDFLTELVERKRSILYATLDNKDVEWEESSLMVELANALHTRGLKKWSA
jgi:SNF2 family DNA or RNA helicase